MEWWSDGGICEAPGAHHSSTPNLQYSNTPILHHSILRAWHPPHLCLPSSRDWFPAIGGPSERGGMVWRGDIFHARRRTGCVFAGHEGRAPAEQPLFLRCHCPGPDFALFPSANDLRSDRSAAPGNGKSLPGQIVSAVAGAAGDCAVRSGHGGRPLAPAPAQDAESCQIFSRVASGGGRGGGSNFSHVAWRRTSNQSGYGGRPGGLSLGRG